MYPEIYIFRHGETNVTKNGLSSYGEEVFSAPILPDFIPSIEKMGDFLKSIPSQLNFSSEILRCRQTAEVISRVTGKKFEFDGRLNEVAPGESFFGLSSRVSDFVRGLEEYHDETVMICTHGALIAALAQFVIKNDFTEKDYGNFPPPGTVWRVTNKIEEVFKI